MKKSAEAKPSCGPSSVLPRDATESTCCLSLLITKPTKRDYAAAASLLESGAAASEEIGEPRLAGVMCERRGAALFNDHEFEAFAD